MPGKPFTVAPGNYKAMCLSRKYEIAIFEYATVAAGKGEVIRFNWAIVVNQLVNLDKSRSWGVEVESRWAPVDNLLIMANYAYINNEIRTACCFADSSDPTGAQPGAKPVPGQGGAQDLKGNRLPGSSKHKITVAASYTFEHIFAMRQPPGLLLCSDVVFVEPPRR